MNIKPIAILLSIGINMMPRNFTHTLYLRPIKTNNEICFSLKSTYETQVDLYVKDKIICSENLEESEVIVHMDESLLKNDCLDIDILDMDQKRYHLKIWYHSKINRIHAEHTIIYDKYYYSSNDIIIENQNVSFLSFSGYQAYLDLDSKLSCSAFIYPKTTLDYIPSVSLYLILPKGIFFFLPYDSPQQGYLFPLKVEQVFDRLILSLKNNYSYQEGTFELMETQNENLENIDRILLPLNKSKEEFIIRYIFQMKDYQIICEQQCLFSDLRKPQVQFS